MPRCRTMIDPAVTSWPSPALTPRRWPTLSRPFFELEPAFLWAIACYSSFFRREPRLGASPLSVVFFWSAEPGREPEPRAGPVGPDAASEPRWVFAPPVRRLPGWGAG